VQVVAVHGLDRDELTGNITAVRHEHQIHLQLKGGELRRLVFPNSVDEVGFAA
jgi:hypothetical protein